MQYFISLIEHSNSLHYILRIDTYLFQYKANYFSSGVLVVLKVSVIRVSVVLNPFHSIDIQSQMYK